MGAEFTEISKQIEESQNYRHERERLDKVAFEKTHINMFSEQEMIECFNAGYSNGHMDTGMNALYYLTKLKDKK